MSINSPRAASAMLWRKDSGISRFRQLDQLFNQPQSILTGKRFDFVKNVGDTHIGRVSRFSFQDKLHLTEANFRLHGHVFSIHLINSWNEAGTILQAAEPEEVIEGGPKDWAKLRELLARRRKVGRDSVHPQSAAVGYITYEGAFRFAWFPKIALLKENGFSALWMSGGTAG